MPWQQVKCVLLQGVALLIFSGHLLPRWHTLIGVYMYRPGPTHTITAQSVMEKLYILLLYLFNL